MRSAILTLTLVALSLLPQNARAQRWNNPGCRSPGRPPVILVHGRGGDVNQLQALRDALGVGGFCVFGVNYGHERPGGPAGLARLDASAAQMDAYIDYVRGATGAATVDIISHSAGQGVVDNIIHRRGGGWKVRKVVSLGGLHHPYAHIGVPYLADLSLFLPNITATARRIVPGIEPQSVIRTALQLYAAGAGTPLEGTLFGIDSETAASGFAADLFEPEYWESLHGSLSEPPGRYIVTTAVLLPDSEEFGGDLRSLHTLDSDPDICYLNLISAGDLITGASAGTQDRASNVVNFVLPGLADHSQIVSDPSALAMTIASLQLPCIGRDGSADPEPGTPMRPDSGEMESDGGIAHITDAGLTEVPDAGTALEDALRDAGFDASPDSRPESVLEPDPSLDAGCGCGVAKGKRPWAELGLPLFMLACGRRQRSTRVRQ